MSKIASTPETVSPRCHRAVCPIAPRRFGLTVSLLGAIVLLGVISVARALTVPDYVNYQGTLKNASGQALNGPYPLSFSIWDGATGGNLVWGPQRFRDARTEAGADTRVRIVDGQFNVKLGPQDEQGSPRMIKATFAEGAQRFVEVTVGEGAEAVAISPRQQILTTPYAFAAQSAQYATEAQTATNAVRAQSAQTADNGVPVATIFAYAATSYFSPPAGYLFCDGSVKSQAEYPALYNAIGKTYDPAVADPNFRLPDLRGRLPVGHNTQSPVYAENPQRMDGVADYVANTGGTQYNTLTTDQMPVHGHNLKAVTGVSVTGIPPVQLIQPTYASIYFPHESGSSSGVQVSTTNIANGSSKWIAENNGNGTAVDNMPPFIVFFYIIKY